MGTGLLNVEQFKARTIMPPADVDYLETKFPGFLQTEIDELTSYMESRLHKRYATPFSRVSPPYTAVRWLVSLVTERAYDKRGRNPTSEQDARAIDGPADRARDELKEAADSVDGLFDLPLREDLPGSSGLTQGGTLAYSEASPYDSLDRQREAVRGD